MKLQWNEIMHTKHLEKYLASGKDPMNVTVKHLAMKLLTLC